MKISSDYLGLSNSCSYNVHDVIGRADRFGFQNFCSPGLDPDQTAPLGLHWLPRPICPKTWDHYDNLC